ncbi:hypothetical protein [Winogradskyella sp. A3E31]|uniref:hypothetical protein n=1 Tax=Winogradskyella sp. A3E31 TaxID=3349637 RepID=UPI00398A5BD7
MKRKHLYLFLSTIMLFTTSCTNDSEDDLIDNTPQPNTITYVDDVRPIIQTNCTSCHGDPPTNAAPNSMVNYSQVVDAVENRGLINRISSQPGESGFMPLGGSRLPQNLIDLIEQWEDEGFIEQ